MYRKRQSYAGKLAKRRQVLIKFFLGHAVLGDAATPEQRAQLIQQLQALPKALFCLAQVASAHQNIERGPMAFK